MPVRIGRMQKMERNCCRIKSESERKQDPEHHGRVDLVWRAETPVSVASRKTQTIQIWMQVALLMY